MDVQKVGFNNVFGSGGSAKTFSENKLTSVWQEKNNCNKSLPGNDDPVVTYDEFGHKIVTQTKTNKNGEKTETATEYDTNGNLRAKKETNFAKDGSKKSYTRESCLESGEVYRKEEAKYYSGTDKLKSVKVIKYNISEAGQQELFSVEKLKYDGTTNEPSKSTERVYDDNGHVETKTKSTYFEGRTKDKDYKVKSEEVTEYDENGKKQVKIYNYDENGNLIE